MPKYSQGGTMPGTGNPRQLHVENLCFYAKNTHYESSTIHLQFYTEVRLCPQYLWPHPHKPKWILENLFQVWFCIINLKTRNSCTRHHISPKSNWNVCIKIFIIATWPFLSIKSFCAILLTGWIFSFFVNDFKWRFLSKCFSRKI